MSRELTDIAVQFIDDQEVPWPFRAKSLRSRVAARPNYLSLREDEKPLAVSDMGPVWTVSIKEGIRHYRSGFHMPAVPPERNLQDVVNGERFLELLPLLHWLRELCVADYYEGPLLRACFMFDDPNLHWHRYGHVDFRKLAAEAAKENFHVSFATIPLDTWYTHQATAQVFRENAQYLSLLVHGNNHTHMELAQDYTRAECTALLSQALTRIERLEKKGGLQVARVMAAPHGACSGEMLRQLPQCGFEAATISHGSLRAHNRSAGWTRFLGYLPSEVVHNCPVLPRWRLASHALNSVLLAAFLRQPIILVGHHDDLRNGSDILSEFARVINGLGTVLWSNMEDLTRANYMWRLEKNVYRVKPFARKLRLLPPPEGTQLLLDNPLCVDWRWWRASVGGGTSFQMKSGEALPLSAGAAGVISLEALLEPLGSQSNVSYPPGARTVLRRILAEGRDRFLA